MTDKSVKDKDKKRFIVSYLEGLMDILDIRKGPFSLFARESWHYKDLRITGLDPDVIYRRTNNLRYRGILKGAGVGRFKFTEKGTLWLEKSSRRYFRSQNKKWDKKWRVVIFDIPQDLHTARVRLRRRLKNLGLHMLQKSVFVFPYPLEEELGYICKQLEISDYVDVILAEQIGFKEKELKFFFNL